MKIFVPHPFERATHNKVKHLPDQHLHSFNQTEKAINHWELFSILPQSGCTYFVKAHSLCLYLHRPQLNSIWKSEKKYFAKDGGKRSTSQLLVVSLTPFLFFCQQTLTIVAFLSKKKTQIKVRFHALTASEIISVHTTKSIQDLHSSHPWK